MSASERPHVPTDPPDLSPPPVAEEHPLRILRALVDRALERGTPDPPSPPLTRAILLRALCSFADDAELREHLEHNRLYRWFSGLSEDQPTPSEAQLGAARAELMAPTRAGHRLRQGLGAALGQAEAEGLLARGHLRIDERRLSALTGRRAPSPILFAVFLLSGAAALIYQLVWQRLLFAIYGIDTASVTIVVTAFMLGLGGGSLVGGRLSRGSTRRSLALFAAFEIGIGLFGLASLSLFAWVASFTLGVGHAMTFVITFLLVLLPTTLMGATLPLLVDHATRRTGNVGRSVANLYAVNTLGAALGAYAAVSFMFSALGLSGSTRWAAMLNLALGLTVALLYLRERARERTREREPPQAATG